MPDFTPQDVLERNQKQAEGMWQDGKPKKWYYAIPIIVIWIIIVSIVTIFGGEIPIGWVVNPETDNVLIPIIAIDLPNTKIVNGLNIADMGIGSLIAFGGLLIILNKHQYEQV